MHDGERLLKLSLCKRAVPADAGIVHEQVDPAFGFEDTCSEGCDRGLLGEVEKMHDDPCFLQGTHPVDSSGRSVDTITAFEQGKGGSFPDSTRGTGNEGNFWSGVVHWIT